MTLYEVEVVAVANVRQRTIVNAETKEEAEKIALDEDHYNNLVWYYQGLSDDPNLEVTRVTPIG